jgi:hypothetical protein
MNSVLGQFLTSAVQVQNGSDLSCSPGESKIFFQFIDPNTQQVVPISSPNGKIISVTSCAGEYLAFGKYLGIPNFQVSAYSTGSVPVLDVVICFDVSGSMDDQTNVTFAKRYYDKTIGLTEPIALNGAAQGTIANILLPPPTGTSLNALLPQCLEESDNNYLKSQYQLGHPIKFANDYDNNPARGLRSLAGYTQNGEVGQPPGNYPPGTADSFQGDTSYYTDVVVNLDGNAQFGGGTFGGLPFPNYQSLIEAARGNLDSQAAYTSSLANTVVKNITPNAGYSAAYNNAAMKLVQPMMNSQSATQTFCDILNTDTDCHFGFVAFDTAVGTNSTGYEQWYSLEEYIPYGTFTNYPEPFVALDPVQANTNYNFVYNTAIPECRAMGGTNIGLAIHTAVLDMKAHARKGSVKAIILFTDGEPTAGTPLDNDPATNARMAASEAAAAGIPVYTIGLAQTQAIIPSETAILNDTDSNPQTGGIAAISGHGATFNLVSDSSLLRAAFERIAHRLVELVSTSKGDYLQ